MRTGRAPDQPAKPTLNAELLGKVRFAAADREIALANRKCRALLGYLLLSDTLEETRERLIGMLWSETEEARARASLRQTLYELRAAFDEAHLDILTTSKVSVGLDRKRVKTDLGEVLDLAKEGAVHPRLIELENLTDTLLADVDTIDPAFQTWLAGRRQALHDQLARHLANALRESGGAAKADLARALLNLDATDEEAARTLMRLRAEAGDMGGALSVYKRLWDLLAEEFDTEPSEETQALAVAIKLGDVASAPPSDSVGLAEINGPATLAIVALGVSGEQVRALEHVLTRGDAASWQPLDEESQRSWLVEATSASEAARLAFSLQAACRDMPNAPRLLIGAHAQPLRTAAGSGVNQALAAIAEPGQIVTSQEFRDRLTDGLDATVNDLGFVSVPRLDASVRAFTVAPPEEPLAVDLSVGLRLRPAIAVLPFELQRPDGETLGELLADEVIMSLSGAKDLDVISRLSTRFVNRRQFGLDEIWSHLQSDYVLAGKLASAGEFVVELTDVRSRIVRWSESRRADALDSQAVRELAEWIAAEVMKAILISESERAATSPLASLQSYTLLFAAITLMDRWTRASFERSHQLLATLRERAPAHSLPNAWLAAWHIRSVSQGWSRDSAADGHAAIEFAQRSLDFDPYCSLALAMDGWANVYAHKRLDIAAERLSLAVEANPNDSLAWLLKGVTHAFSDEGDVALASAARAQRLSPLDPRRSYYDSLIATAAFAAHRYDQGIELAKRSMRANRLHPSTLRALAACQWHSGRQDDARQTVAQLLTLNPEFTIGKYLHAHPAADSAFGRRVADALRLAGVPA